MSSDNPIQWLEKIVFKDKEAFERFYDHFAPMTYGLSLKILARPMDAQEVLQDVFLEVWNRASSYNEARGTLKAWLVTMTRSRSIDRLRARKRRHMNVDSIDALAASKNGFDIAIPKNSGQSEAQLSLQGILEEISAEERKVLEMAYFEGRTQSEIAQLLEWPLGTVKTRMRQGLKTLRTAIERKEKRVPV